MHTLARTYSLSCFLRRVSNFHDTFVLGPNLEFRKVRSIRIKLIARSQEVCGWVSWTILSAFLIERLHLSFLPSFQEAEFFLPFLPFADPTIVRNVFRRSEVEGNDQLPYRDTRARDLTTLTSRSKGARNIGGERREKERRETSGVPAE